MNQFNPMILVRLKYKEVLNLVMMNKLGYDARL